MPQWVIQQLETISYDFFWSYKWYLVNKDTLALLLGEGGFNIPYFQTRIHAFRLNTLQQLLEQQDAHWKYFVPYFLCVSHMRTRKLNLVLEYNTNHIEPSTPPLHKELLTTWLIHKQLWRCVHPTTISKWASICLRGTPYVFWLDVSWYNTNQGSHIWNCTRLSTNTSNPWTPHQTTWGK